MIFKTMHFSQSLAELVDERCWGVHLF